MNKKINIILALASFVVPATIAASAQAACECKKMKDAAATCEMSKTAGTVHAESCATIAGRELGASDDCIANCSGQDDFPAEKPNPAPKPPVDDADHESQTPPMTEPTPHTSEAMPPDAHEPPQAPDAPSPVAPVQEETPPTLPPQQ